MKPVVKIKVEEISGATFTSSSFESTVQDLINGGADINNSDVELLLQGKSVKLVSYNRVGTPFKRILTKI